jgi:RNA polymerase sigma-70 factor (ECF subfamily)
MPDSKDTWFEETLSGEAPRLWSFLLALVGDRQGVEDLYQATCLELWRIRRTFRPGTDFGAWSRTVAKYQLLRYWRRSRREKVLFSSEAIERISEAYRAPRSEPAVDERRRALERCLEALPAEGRKLLEARYGVGTPVRTLARDTSVSEAGLKMRLLRLRQRLADCVRARLSGKEEVHGRLG